MEASNQIYQIVVSGLLAVMIFIALVSACLLLLEWDGVLLFLFGK